MVETKIKDKFVALLGKKIYSFHPIEGGISNVSYAVNDSYVVRVPSSFVQPFNDFKKEKTTLETIAPLNISEKVIYFDEKDGFKISRFVHGGLLYKDSPTLDQIRMTGKTIKKLHRSNVNIPYGFELLKRLETYKPFAKKEMIDQRYEKKIVRLVKALLEKDNQVICHNDLVRGNLLYKFDKLVIIDWEYSGMNHPYFDLASFISENNLDKEQSESFLSIYFGAKLNDLKRKRVRYFIEFSDILWYYWAMMMKAKNDSGIYIEIALEKKARISNNIKKKVIL